MSTKIATNITYLWATYYANEWDAIPVALHFVRERRQVWDADTAQYLVRPVCSCSQGENCANPGKHPVVGWRQRDMGTPREGLAAASSLLEKEPRYGLALRTGPESGLVVIDVDIREGKRGDLALSDALKEHGIPASFALRTLVQTTGSGGKHYIYRYPRNAKIPTVTNHPVFGPGVDVKGDGGIFNVCPTVHKNGAPYAWLAGHAADQIAELPDALVELLEKKDEDPYSSQNAKLEAYTPDENDILELAHKLKTQRKNQKLREVGRNLDRAMKLEPLFKNGGAHDGYRDMAYHVAHEWPMLDLDTVLELFRPSIEARLAERPEASTDVENFRDALQSALSKAIEFHKSWAAKLLRDNAGSPYATTANVRRILQNDPEIRESIVYDGRRKMPRFLKPICGLAGEFPRLMMQEDRAHIAAWMEDKYNISQQVPFKTIFELIVGSTQQNPVDEFAEWIRSRPAWDGTRRLATLMQLAGDADNTEWVREIMPIWFRGFVRRVLEPGYKIDTMLILEGEQGYKKSTFFRAILPYAELFNDSLHRLTQDESTLRLLHSGPAIHEVGDLAGFGRSQLNELKSFLSATQDAVRPLYQSARIVPRNFIIVGSTNEEKYLKDPTGQRRFLPVKVNKVIDTDYIEDIRDQLYAEALYDIKQGAPDYFSTEMYEKYKEYIENRAEDPDAWDEIIRAALDKEVPDKNEPEGVRRIDSISATEVLTNILDMELKNITRKEQMRVAACLKAMGWKSHKKNGCNRWKRPGQDVAKEFTQRAREARRTTSE